jgi:hypothetical protein
MIREGGARNKGAIRATTNNTIHQCEHGGDKQKENRNQNPNAKGFSGQLPIGRLVSFAVLNFKDGVKKISNRVTERSEISFMAGDFPVSAFEGLRSLFVIHKTLYFFPFLNSFFLLFCEKSDLATIQPLNAYG